MEPIIKNDDEQQNQEGEEDQVDQKEQKPLEYAKEITKNLGKNYHLIETIFNSSQNGGVKTRRTDRLGFEELEYLKKELENKETIHKVF